MTSRRRAAAPAIRRAPEPRRSGLFYLVGIVVFAATVIGVVGIGRHRNHEARDDAQSREADVKLGPRVRVATVKQASSIRHLTLQGEARPFFEVTLYAKVAGFLSDLKVDKGDRVKKNQLIAKVTAPELDAQYTAAVADARNKRVNAKRLTALAPAGVVSAQELELGQANADVADATQSAIATQRDYRVIRAPFDGVIIARFADPGTLIQSAANAQSGAVPIVSVSKGDELRVYVYVDQSSAPFVHAGDAAVITVPERPGWSRQAKISRTSGQLSPRTRTMLTEVDISNDDHLIVPGSYVQVTLDVRIPPLLEMPAEALVTRDDKPAVAIVDGTGHVHYKPVVVASDDGQVVRLVSGVDPDTRVALDLGSSVQDGSPVQVVEAPTPPGPPAGAGGLPPTPLPRADVERGARRVVAFAGLRVGANLDRRRGVRSGAERPGLVDPRARAMGPAARRAVVRHLDHQDVLAGRDRPTVEPAEVRTVQLGDVLVLGDDRLEVERDDHRARRVVLGDLVAVANDDRRTPRLLLLLRGEEIAHPIAIGLNRLVGAVGAERQRRIVRRPRLARRLALFVGVAEREVGLPAVRMLSRGAAALPDERLQIGDGRLQLVLLERGLTSLVQLLRRAAAAKGQQRSERGKEHDASNHGWGHGGRHATRNPIMAFRHPAAAALTPERRPQRQAAGGRGGEIPTCASAAFTALRSSQASFFLLGSRKR